MKETEKQGVSLTHDELKKKGREETEHKSVDLGSISEACILDIKYVWDSS
jgi:hypothetical protein